MDSWDGPSDSAFDEELAKGYLGKYLLVGITATTNEGEVLSREELHGVIVAATASGIDIELQGVNEGKTWRMPPFLDELSPARPGIYALKSTGESVENPDFIFSIRVRKPVHQ